MMRLAKAKSAHGWRLRSASRRCLCQSSANIRLSDAPSKRPCSGSPASALVMLEDAFPDLPVRRQGTMLRCALLGASKLARAGHASGRTLDGFVRAQAVAASAPAVASQPAQTSFVRGFAAEPALAPSTAEGTVSQARRSTTARSLTTVPSLPRPSPLSEP